jgi:2-keto-4-pentenoate hydratase/2-oxohepta-3-ene-1,7-dioic acid hydratase in catechol pathway
MRLLRFDAGQGPRLGALAGKIVVDLLKAALRFENELRVPAAALQVWFGREMEGLIESGPPALEVARQVMGRIESDRPREDKAGGTWELRAVRLLAPLRAPSKIIAVGLNYMDHCREQKIDPPPTPVLFSKAPSALIGPGDSVSWPRDLTHQVDPEVELGVVISRSAKGLTESSATEFIFGYTIINDLSARDIQFGDKQWVRGKSLDTFCPVGPWLVTRDEIPDPQALALKCAVNGRNWQDSNTREMIFPVVSLLSFISRGITLLPGDLIATGTPHGVGVFQNPPVFLSSGDVLRLEIEKIGFLENRVAGAR